ncbi:hypothetical protein RHMOL_Rhmol01G0128900 [Rhododendron molle]|uniref:Uncharacterized protein n=1 Tax=Rhododendron molle TaxID=49168 RepID=A0ACC0Q2U0_RHOML|nr:hypothetical protein RHMOL_Rhmol01G0128900 [Rhododendron molle]
MVPPTPSTHGGPSTAQHTQQFLSSVLSQRGLPYPEDVKWLIRQHLVSLSDSYPSLQPRTSVYTHNDGRAVTLLQADGTLPMVFQGVTYNIPVVFWLMESYPKHPPLVYVNPTRDMIIKRPHPFVNPSGNVSIPYLHNWVYPSSNLLDLARDLSLYFARDPPLYSQRRPSSNNPPNPNPNFAAPTNSVSVAAQPAIPPRSYPQSPYGGGGGSGRVAPRREEDAGEVFRRDAMNKLVERVDGDVRELRKRREGEMEGMFSAQAVLRKREEEIGRGFRGMLEEKEALEQQLQVVLMNSDVLEGWLRENEGKMVDARSLSVDEAFEPCDALSKQILECTAADLAIEDVIYSLDKAVQEGAMPFDQYLRNVRFLSREQFLHRATTSKVRAAQMQAQVNSMAAKAPQYAV